MSNDQQQLPDLTRYGPWAVIAGGSEGVGAAFAELLADAGLNLVLAARKPAPLEACATECRSRGVEVRTCAVDLTTPEGRQVVIDAAEGTEVGLLVFNAGSDSAARPFLDDDPSHITQVIDLNVTAPLALVRHFGPGMRARRRGGILTIGSLAGDLGTTQHAVYGGAKAFGRIFTEALWLELREYDVDVLHLVLGVTRTPAMARVGLDFDAPGIPVSEPGDVALQGLRQLPDGPVQIAEGFEAGARFRADPDRAKVVLKSHRLSARLAPAGE